MALKFKDLKPKYKENKRKSQLNNECHKQENTTHLSGWQKVTTLTTNVDKDAEKQELSAVAPGNAKSYSHFGKRLKTYI